MTCRTRAPGYVNGHRVHGRQIGYETVLLKVFVVACVSIVLDTCATVRKKCKMRTNGEAPSWSGDMNVRGMTNISAKGQLLIQATEDAAPFPRGEIDELKKNFRAVQEENFKLQAVITDVTEVNKRWQKYNNDRQLYVQRLLSTIQDQQEQMNKIVEERIIHSKGVCDKAGDSVALPAEAVLEERNKLREEVARLTRQLEATRREHREHLEHIEVLELQLKAHRDDWEAERSEKQQALQEKDAAQRRVSELQHDLRALKQKVREEKLLACTHCKCCEAHVSEIDQCNIFLPGSKVNMCRKNHGKMYRTSVHVPCTSTPLLPRGTTIFFSDDLVVDGTNKDGTNITELSNEVLKLREDVENLGITSSKDEEQPVVMDVKSCKSVSQKQEMEFDGNNNSSKSYLPEELSVSRDSSFNIIDRDISKDSVDVRKRKSSTAELNLEHDGSLSQSSQNLAHITPSTSASSVELAPLETVTRGDGASGVTIGFDNSGLASVMGFSHVPIAKSSSLPEKKELRKEGVNPLVSRWSFDSYTAFPIAQPPSSHNFGTSMDSLIQESGVRRTTFVSNDVNLPPQSQKLRGQKVKYSEEGVLTQTEDDVICPGCGQIFPPKMHLKFLDHFEECQSKGEEVIL